MSIDELTTLHNLLDRWSMERGWNPASDDWNHVIQTKRIVEGALIGLGADPWPSTKNTTDGRGVQ